MVGLHGPAARAFFAVTAGGPGWRNLMKLVDDVQFMDVAGVQDAIDAAESIEHLRPEFGPGLGDMGIGDEANAHTVG
jgi:hypothetical protein